MSNAEQIQPQNGSGAQRAVVPGTADTPYWNKANTEPGVTELTNCSICSELTQPHPSHLCESCRDDYGSEALARLADRLVAEPESPLDEALQIASGQNRLLLPTKDHLRAMYVELERMERYTKTLEYCCGQMLQEVERVNDGLQGLLLRSMDRAETTGAIQ